MKKFIDFSTLNEIGVYISLFLGLCTIAYWFWKYAVSLINYSKIRNVKSGIYNGYWIDPIKKEVNCEVLKLKKTITGIKIMPIYKHKAFHDYKVFVKPYHLNKFIFGGYWIGQKNTNYKGSALFLYNIEENSFSGKWIGPKSTGEINSGDWVINFFIEVGNAYLSYSKHKKFNELKERVFPAQTILDSIIEKHDSFSDKSCIVKNITLDLNKDSFIPVIGKISIPLVEYIESIAKSTDSILDLGTGTGFYPIYLAKNIGCMTKGIDVEESTLTLARGNAIQNGVNDLVHFDICSKGELFSSIKKSEKFDLIVANLPFTRISKSYKSRSSIHYSSFSGSVNLLEQLILGSQYHIKPDGKLIFCYGESGYMNLLESLVKISSWKYLKKIKTIHHKDDTFYIFELELSVKVKDFYQKINTEQKLLSN
jgi:methylase of polypeptide subunit release factors